MNKFRYRSPIGIIFIFLFLITILCSTATIITGNSLLAAAAIILSLFQLKLHTEFQRKHTVWRNLSLTYFIRRAFPNLPIRISQPPRRPVRSTSIEKVMLRKQEV